MSEIAQRATRAIAQMQGIVDSVCGSCGNSCCHQGTMMGSHDLRRLIKGMRLEAGREGIVRRGLEVRAGELRADLETLRGVRGLAAAAGDDEQQDALRQLDAVMEDWEGFCDLIAGAWGAEFEAMQPMLRFAGIRAVALRIVAGFPGGHGALSTLAAEGSSFKFRGRRLAPPRCLFHDATDGCLAGRWKPGKCAGFFCAGDPNVLRELRQQMSFEDFVLANSAVAGPQAALEAVRMELELGAEYVEPKVFVGLAEEHLRALEQMWREAGRTPYRPEGRSTRFMKSSAEVEAMVQDLTSDQVCVVECDRVDGAALYELAIALDRYRAAGEALGFVLAASEFDPASPLAHPLWADEEMSQPLGPLDLYVIDPTIAATCRAP